MRAMSKTMVLCLICLAVTLPARGQVRPEFWAQNAATVLNLDGSVIASGLPVALVWAAPAFSKAGGSVNSIQCLATVRNRGELKRGLTLTLEGEIMGEEDTLRVLGRKTRPFNPAARFSWGFPDFSADEMAVVLALEGSLSGGTQIDFVKVDCRAINRVKCRSDSRTLCLVGNNRFKVQLDYGSGQGRVALSSPNFGLFTVANPSRADVVVELFDRCGMNDHFWVGVGSATPVSFDVVIEDTLSGETRAFSNPGNGKVVVDGSAFPTCP